MTSMPFRERVVALVAIAASLVAPAAVQAKDIRGTPGPDVLEGWGLGENDTIHGLGGDDAIRGLGGHDRVFGGAGNDWLRGDPRKDLVVGGPGNDRVGGGGSDDVLRGGQGDDVLHPGLGDDIVRGGPGDDLVKAGGDVHVDRIRCGSGWDIVILDGGDRAGASCEVLIRLS